MKQLNVGKNTLLILDSPVPMISFKLIKIDNKTYKPIIAYDIENSIAIEGKGLFEGKKIEFV